MEQTEIDKILVLIRERRKEKKISQQILAEHLGVTQNSYKNIELGKTELKAKTLFDILKFLEIDLFSVKETENKETALITMEPQAIIQTLSSLINDNQDLKKDVQDIKTQNQELKQMIQQLLEKQIKE